jgi:DNA-binding response OmpR family regulator
MTKPVLLIEDDADIRLLAELSLRMAGLEVIACEQGRSGLSVLEKTSVGLVLLDVMMPDMSGYEVLERITERFGDAAPPVALFTARPEDTTEREIAGRKIPIIAKPFEPAGLAQTVRQLMKP